MYETVARIFSMFYYRTQHNMIIIIIIISLCYIICSFVRCLLDSFAFACYVDLRTLYELIDITNGWQISVNNNAISLVHTFSWRSFYELALTASDG